MHYLKLAEATPTCRWQEVEHGIFIVLLKQGLDYYQLKVAAES